MTSRFILPPEQPQEAKPASCDLAAIAGTVIAASLLTTAALLATTHTSLPAWAAFSVGAFFGLSAAISAALLMRPLT